MKAKGQIVTGLAERSGQRKNGNGGVYGYEVGQSEGLIEHNGTPNIVEFMLHNEATITTENMVKETKIVNFTLHEEATNTTDNRIKETKILFNYPCTIESENTEDSHDCLCLQDDDENDN